MDRDVTVKFFRIESARRTIEPLSAQFAKLQVMNQATATLKYDDTPFWCDKIEITQEYIRGRFCRKQTSNLPPKAPDTGGLEPLGVGSLGRTAAWLYHIETAVMAYETTRDGLTLSRFLTYIRDLCDGGGFGFVPVTTDTTLQQLRESRIRSFSFQVATPRNLEFSTTEQQAVASGLKNIMVPDLSTYVEVKYSLDIHDADLKPSAVMRLTQWLRREKAADRGDVTRLRAGIINADGDSKSLELLDEVHLQSRSELELPDDNPELNYQVRKAYLNSAFREHRANIMGQFSSGQD